MHGVCLLKNKQQTNRKEGQKMSQILKNIMDGIILIRSQLAMLKTKHRELSIHVELLKAEEARAESDEAKKAKAEAAKEMSAEEALCQAERLSLREKLSQERERFRKESNKAIDASKSVDELHAIYDALRSLSLSQKRALHKARWVSAGISEVDRHLAHKFAKSRHRHSKKRTA